MTTKITTTPTPLAVVDKINSIIDDKLDKTGTAASATTLSGLTATVAELNYVDGVTSNIQTQLNGKLSTSGKAVSAATADSASNVTGTVAITNGGTGATTAANARTNLGLSTAFTDASISGKVITLTKADGTTTTLTTQDTSANLTPNYSAGITQSVTTSEKSYTCPADGVVCVCLGGFNGAHGYLKINNQTMFDVWSSTNDFFTFGNGQYAVKKGDVVKYKTGYDNASAMLFTFYPYA